MRRMNCVHQIQSLLRCLSSQELMKRYILLLLWILAAACSQDTFHVSEVVPVDSAMSTVPTHIVHLNPAIVGVTWRQHPKEDQSEHVRSVVQQLFTRLDLSATAEFSDIYGNIFLGFSAKLTDSDVALLLRQKEVLGIEVNAVYGIEQQTPTPFRQKETIALPEQKLPWGVGYVQGPGKPSGKRAWILDTGIDMDHPDLNVNIEDSRCFLPWSYFEFEPEDLNGHGTHIAGVIGALNNSIGVVGIAPGTEVVAVKVLSRNGIGVLSSILTGLEYVGAQAKVGDVVNLSFSGRASAIFDRAVAALGEKGIRIVIAAGNSARTIEMVSPARVEAPFVFTVSAIDTSGAFAVFSNFGKGVDFSEPGMDILSTYKEGSYAVLSGTSSAAPHLAGLLLLQDATLLAQLGVAAGDPDGLPDTILGIQKLAN